MASATPRRTTRSQSRLSEGAEPVDAGSARSTRAAHRRAPDVIAKPNHNYGALDSLAPAQSQRARSAKIVAANRLQTGVGAAIQSVASASSANGSASAGNLSAVQEEDTLGDDGGAASSSMGGDPSSAVTDDRTSSNFTGFKSFGRETLDTRRLQQQSRATTAPPDRVLASRQPIAPNQLVAARQAVLLNQPYTPYEPAPVNILNPTIWEIAQSWVSKWMWVALLIGVIISLTSAALSDRRYRQITSTVRVLNNETLDNDNNVSPLLPSRWGRRLDKLEEQQEQFEHKLENAARREPATINWLAYDLGARANAYLCSPAASVAYLGKKSKYSPKNLWSSWAKKINIDPVNPDSVDPDPYEVKMRPSPVGPNTALTGWVEHEPRYCAPSSRGKLQLAVSLARPIVPSDLVIEHFRRDTVPYIGTAPKEVEFWLHIPDPAKRDSVGREITALHPEIMTADYTQSNRRLDQKQALDSSWVPVGRWEYSISGADNVQKFHIPIDLASLDVSVKNVAVRVNSNWGNYNRTCLVRAKMYGKDVSGIKEYLDDGREAVDRA